MTNSKQDNESRLGHDPLEWLEEDIANLTSDEEDTDAPGQHLESTPTEEHSPALSAPLETEPETEPEAEPELELEAQEPQLDVEPQLVPDDSLDAPENNHSQDTEIEQNAKTGQSSAASNELIPGFSLSKTDGKLTLPERLSVQVAEATHQDWLQILEISDLYSLQIDATRLNELDAAGLQLLFAFSQSLEKQSTKVTLINVPDSIQTIFTLAGLETFFTPLMEAA